MIALLAVVLPLAEWRLGSRQTSWVFLLGDWASTIPVLLALKAAAAAGIAAAATAINQRDAVGFQKSACTSDQGYSATTA
ncbi:MAG: hypothetical protein M3460_23015 [Actinomycetota bacterium]|nr:hypothetical protein [Actinomycetota bacterium]